jgi:hypothetical protein
VAEHSGSGGDAQPHEPPPNDQRLTLLMQYTVFHIGTYIALASVGVAALRGSGSHWLLLPIGMFLVAGVAGSVVGSNIPRFGSYDTFMATPIGVGGRPHFVPKHWMALEHYVFWAGLLAGLAIVAVTRA